MALREEIAEILERIAEEGLEHPRALDSALDAIECTIQDYVFDFTFNIEEGEVSRMLPTQPGQIFRLVPADRLKGDHDGKDHQ